MKQVLVALILSISLFCLSGCGSEEPKKINNKYISASQDSEGNVIINKDEITDSATFINYEVDDIVIQLIAVKASDGTVRLAFNTCQSCNPSPNAYFTQEGEYFICGNCGNKFHIDEIGKTSGGCNPAPIKEKIEEEDEIIIPKDYILSYQDKFKYWKGPIK